MKYLFLFLIFTNLLLPQQSINVEFLSNFRPAQQERFSDVWGYVDGNGNEYAFLCGYTGTYVVNVTNAVNPVNVAFIPGPASIWKDVKTHSTFAYIVTEGRGTGQGLQIVDLSNLPNSATLVNTINNYFTGAHNIFIDNGFAYVIGTEGGGGMHILDLSNPTNPVRTNYYSASGYIHDVYVWNDTVVVCAGSSQNYHLVDVSNKFNPVKISESISLPGIYAHAGWMTEDKRYFFGTEEFNVRDITVWDLQDRTSWELVVPSWQMPTGTTVHNLFIKDSIAHISYYGDGYVALNISDPTNPKILGYYDTYPGVGQYDGAWGAYPFLPSGNILVSDIQSGLFVFKLSNDFNPVIVHTNISEYNNTEVINIKTNVYHNTFFTDVIIYFRTIKENITSNWFSVNGTKTSNLNEYSFVIPSQTHKTKLEYYFAVKDINNKVVTLPFGGSGINPPGNLPPSTFFSSNIIIPGIPIINTFFPHNDTLISTNGAIPFSIVAIDTSDLTLVFRWTKNSQFVSQASSYNYKSFPFMPFPRVDTIKVTASNGYNLISKSWLVSVDEILSVEDNFPNDYFISQNFPNPFNPVTLIKYSIPTDDIVSIEIFNILGEKVHTLLNEVKSKGEHQIIFNASGFSSGIYFTRIKSGSFIQNIKMVLMK